MAVFRPYCTEDIEAMIELEHAVFPHPWPRSAFNPDLLGNCYVIEESKQLIGFIICIVVMDECSIVNVAIRPELQSLGYGKQLLGSTLSALKAEGINLFFLDVRVSNLKAKKLYESFGFYPIAVRKDYYSEPDEDAIVMFCDLDAANQVNGI